jgi:hypothetical protein
LLASGFENILIWPVPTVDSRNDGRNVKSDGSQLDKWWSDLASENAHRAYVAIGGLSRARADAIRFFGERLHSLVEAPFEKVRGLIADLDAPDFERREKAAKELDVLGEQAAKGLQAALEGRPSPEQRRRIEQILNTVPDSPERIRHVRAAETLERIGNAEAQDLLRELATGMPEARLTQEAQASLRRLTHRE